MAISEWFLISVHLYGETLFTLQVTIATLNLETDVEIIWLPQILYLLKAAARINDPQTASPAPYQLLCAVGYEP